MTRSDATEARRSGVLLHPTSLPGPFGCGDLGPAARRFVEQLAVARQSYWQMLPVCPLGKANSPYSSPSSFAGSPLLISPESLAEDGLLDANDLRSPALPARKVHYLEARRLRERLLRRAFENFNRHSSTRDTKRFDAFCHAHRSWLGDHSLFMALKRAHRGGPWLTWEPKLRNRDASALARAREQHRDEIRYHSFVQYQFDRQWQALVKAAQGHGVLLVGDVPFYVEHDSADVWAHREVFDLTSSGRPRRVAGVAPDYFARNGQLWGNPLYDWEALERTGYRWWFERLERSLGLFDLVRLDHFIAFHRYWTVPVRARTARHGSYRPGPGAKFFTRLRIRLGRLPFIAEDLGIMVPEVHALRDQFKLPGMRVLQFSFGGDPRDESRPFACPRRAVVYTGTHDNDTATGWFRDRGTGASSRTPEEAGAERSRVLKYLGTKGKEFHWDLIRLALMSPANTAIVPLQDVLGLGTPSRMNRPGIAKGNWEWRFSEGDLDRDALLRLGALTETYGRAPEPRQ